MIFFHQRFNSHFFEDKNTFRYSVPDTQIVKCNLLSFQGYTVIKNSSLGNQLQIIKQKKKETKKKQSKHRKPIVP